MTETSQVRVALPSDEDELMELCRSLHSENGLFPMSDTKVREVLRSTLKREKGPMDLRGIIGVIGQPIHSAIWMLITTQWYTDAWHLEELFSFVKPENRKSNNAKNLIKFAEECAVQLKLPLTIGVITNSRTEAKVALYKRQLGGPAGAFFVFNSPWDATKIKTMTVHNGQQN